MARKKKRVAVFEESLTTAELKRQQLVEARAESWCVENGIDYTPVTDYGRARESARAGAKKRGGKVRVCVWLPSAEHKGSRRDATAHVKGRKAKKGQELRVHFFADYEDGRLVVAHCGEHLETFETSRL